MQIMDCGVWVMNCGHWIADHGRWIMDCVSQIVELGLWIIYSRSQNSFNNVKIQKVNQDLICKKLYDCTASASFKINFWMVFCEESSLRISLKIFFLGRACIYQPSNFHESKTLIRLSGRLPWNLLKEAEQRGETLPVSIPAPICILSKSLCKSYSHPQRETMRNKEKQGETTRRNSGLVMRIVCMFSKSFC